MRAAQYDRYGAPDVVRVGEVPDPPSPGPGQLLVRNGASVVAASDAAARSGSPWFARLYFGLVRPRHGVLGGVFAGEVVAVGPGAHGYAAGDRVVGLTASGFGAHAEVVTVPADGVVARTPAGVTDAEAVAAVDGALTALPFLRDGAQVAAGRSVLVNGASGAVGTAAVQLAVHLGARVTAVCSSTGLDLVSALGAEQVVDYTVEDFTRRGETYDVVFDVAGVSSFRRARSSLTEHGVYLTTVPSLPALWHTARAALAARTGRARRGRRGLVAFTGLRSAPEKTADLHLLVDLLERGTLRGVVDRAYPLERVADAHRHVDAGRRRGTVVVLTRDA